MSDSFEIANIHLKSFPNFFLSTLGLSFLKIYYRSCAESNYAISICAVAKDDDHLCGFAVGCFNSNGFNKRLVLDNSIPFGLQAIRLIFTKPFAFFRLLKNFQKGESFDDMENCAELMSIGVIPDKMGLGIGQKLLINFEKKVKEKGIKFITLTTDLSSNDQVLKFYKKAGYKIYYEFVSYPNRRMYRLIKQL